MQTKVDTCRITIFLGLAFGIAWLTGLIIYLTGGLVNSSALNYFPLIVTRHLPTPN